MRLVFPFKIVKVEQRKDLLRSTKDAQGDRTDEYGAPYWRITLAPGNMAFDVFDESIVDWFKPGDKVSLKMEKS